MGIRDRDYYRSPGRGGNPLLAWRETAVGGIIAITVACFVVQLVGGPDVTEFLAAQSSAVLGGQVWKLVTANFAHHTGGIGHILWNMFFLFALGHEVEAIYGRRNFYILYLAAGVLSVLAEILFDTLVIGRPEVVVLGASGAVWAVAVLCALFYPTKTVLLFFFVPAPLWLVCVIFLVSDGIGVIGREGDSVAHAAHVTGALVGILYKVLDVRSVPWGSLFRRRRRPRRRREAKILEIPARTAAGSRGGREADQVSRRIDEILAKISSTGKDSLTSDEWDFLRENSGRYKSD
jgi:membrane associated rhomboid family serine protease